MEKILKALRDRRALLLAAIEKAMTETRTEGDADTAVLVLTEEAQKRYDEAKTEVEAIDERVAELVELRDRQTLADDAAKKVTRGGHVQVVREPMTYDRSGRRSYFSDVFLAGRGDPDSQTRLRRHASEQATELERRKSAWEAYRDEIAEEQFEFLKLSSDAGVRDAEKRLRMQLETRDLSRTDGAGGEFVPPLWLIDEFVPLARASRVFADSWNVRPLPPGTDSINVPKVLTGTTTEPQTADNAAVSETDATTSSISAPVRTIAGQQDVAIQLLEQSPVSFDEIVFGDLIAAYNAKLDLQLLNGSGAAGQLQGVLGLAGINAITYTDATPTVSELYPKIADAQNQAAVGRILPATRVFMHTRRWFWHVAAVDSQGRPFVVPMTSNPMNAAGVFEQGQAEGQVGVLQGLTTLADPNVPINLGAGTNEDRIIVCRPPDFWLWESVLRTRTMPEVGSGTLTVRLQLYNYCAATAGRYPAGISVISGTGLITPTF